jgi:hypothetical protein
MRSIFKALLAAGALAALAVAPARAVTTTITDGSGWHTFDFGSANSPFQDAVGDTLGFKFTLTTTDILRITDGYFDGDQFDVAILDVNDFSNLNFETSTPANDGTYVGDCWSCAYFNPTYNSSFSNASVLLGPGTYYVTGFVSQSPYFSGAAALELGGVPEPATWATMLVGFGGLGAMMRRSRRNKAAAATA